MAGYHTRWGRTEEPADDPEPIAIRESLAFGKALYTAVLPVVHALAQAALATIIAAADAFPVILRRLSISPSLLLPAHPVDGISTAFRALHRSPNPGGP